MKYVRHIPPVPISVIYLILAPSIRPSCTSVRHAVTSCSWSPTCVWPPAHCLVLSLVLLLTVCAFRWQSDGMRFFCQTCPYLFQINDKVEKKVPLQRKQVDDVLGGDEAWENVDQTESTWTAALPTTGWIQGETKSVAVVSLSSVQRAARTASTTRRTSCRSRSGRPMSRPRRFTSA